MRKLTDLAGSRAKKLRDQLYVPLDAAIQGQVAKSAVSEEEAAVEKTPLQLYFDNPVPSADEIRNVITRDMEVGAKTLLERRKQRRKGEKSDGADRMEATAPSGKEA